MLSICCPCRNRASAEWRMASASGASSRRLQAPSHKCHQGRIAAAGGAADSMQCPVGRTGRRAATRRPAVVSGQAAAPSMWQSKGSANVAGARSAEAGAAGAAAREAEGEAARAAEAGAGAETAGSAEGGAKRRAEAGAEAQAPAEATGAAATRAAGSTAVRAEAPGAAAAAAQTAAPRAPGTNRGTVTMQNVVLSQAPARQRVR